MDEMTREISRRLQEDADEVSRSLDVFLSERRAALKHQQTALDAYDLEMADLGEGSLSGEEGAGGAPVDHNLMRHMGASRFAALEAGSNFDEYERERERDDFVTDIRDRQFIHDQVVNNKKERVEFDKGLEPKPPVPSVEEKSELREEIFDFLDASRMEEMRVELEYEQLKSQVGVERAEYLAESLFALQKANYAKLKDMFVFYQPGGSGKAWGNDPDYLELSADLERKLALSQASEREEDEKMRKGKKSGGKKKKKAGGHH